jgi:threonine synthase
MEAIRYKDTRGLFDQRLTFSDVVIQGIAPGGGLFVPEHVPPMALADIVSLSSLPYAARSVAVHRHLGVDLPDTLLSHLMAQAYADNFDTPSIAPVREVASGMHVLELWHGPTSAFKDMALQCMPLVFSAAVDARQKAGSLKDDYLVLVATSGDTGKAALEGFADRRHTRIVVFYPAEGVSDLQRKQMVTQRGANVAVFGARGNFDDCQSAVKTVFNDLAYNNWLHDSFSLKLSSANSINWGRLTPQIVYYLSGYADMVAAGAVGAGDPIDVCVPTGNFGNILAASYARRLGVPIERLLCASNENNVLTDFIATGIYDISARAFISTPSPSMDILISSNLERCLYELSGSEAAVREWMRDLTAHGRFEVDDHTRQAMQDLFVGSFVTNDESLATINRVFREYGYLLDPHTSVGWEVAERLRESRPILIASTAHWAKFGADVFKALNGYPYQAVLPSEVAHLSGFELLDEVCRLAPGQSIPGPLAELRSLKERFGQVVEASAKGIEEALGGWLNTARDGR